MYLTLKNLVRKKAHLKIKRNKVQNLKKITK